jgi:hypothetical protein
MVNSGGNGSQIKSCVQEKENGEKKKMFAD